MIPLRDGETGARGLTNIPALPVDMEQGHPCPVLGSVQRSSWKLLCSEGALVFLCAPESSRAARAVFASTGLMAVPLLIS